MRAFVQRPLVLTIFIVAGGLSGRAIAQADSGAAPDVPDEVTVRGRKSQAEYRLELERARNDIFRIFNAANQGDDTDIRCKDEQPTGSRTKRNVCRSNAENQASAAAAQNFLISLFNSSGGFRTNARLGTAGAPAGGTVLNQNTGRSGDTGDVADALQQWEAEWRRLLSDNRDLYNAVVHYAELDEEYAQARGVSTAALPELMRGAPPAQAAGPVCEASTLTEYQQRNNLARVTGTVSIGGCPAGTTGSFTVVARVKNDADETTTLEFNETWQRADTEDHRFETEYPIGDDVFLQSVRVRNLTCTCAEPVQ
jgi:hypothetical protein